MRRICPRALKESHINCVLVLGQHQRYIYLVSNDLCFKHKLSIFAAVKQCFCCYFGCNVCLPASSIDGTPLQSENMCTSGKDGDGICAKYFTSSCFMPFVSWGCFVR